MSPEQVEAKETDQRSDVYSLGVILFEMVTGRVPFDGETPLSVAVKHKSEIPPEPIKFNPQIPGPLNMLILKCMEKDKAKRPQSVEAFISELDKIEQGIPSSERVIPKRKPITSKEFTVTFGFKKILVVSSIIASLAIIAIGIWQLLPKKEPTSLEFDKPIVAVLYFLNDTGDENLEVYKKNLCSWLITDLSQSQLLDVLPMHKLNSIAKNLNLLDAERYVTDDLKKIAEEGQTSHVFQASLTRPGGKFRIDFSLQGGENFEQIATDFVEGESEDSFLELVDRMTTKIKSSLGLSEAQITSDIDQKIADVTTQDPKALEYFIQGEDFHYDFKYAQAIQAFEKAIELDPDFAMAYNLLGAIYYNYFEWAKNWHYVQKAYNLRERTPHKERLLIEANYFGQTEETYDEAIEIYQNILAFDPDDFMANHGLAFAYAKMGETELAIQHWMRLIEGGTKQRLIFSQAAHLTTHLGEYQKARDIYQKYMDMEGELAGYYFQIGATYAIEQKWDLALQNWENVLSLNPNHGGAKLGPGVVSLLQDDFGKAQKIFEEMNSRGNLIELHIAKGQIQKAIELQKDATKKAEIKSANNQRMHNLHQSSAQLHEAADKPDLALKEYQAAQTYLEKEASAAGRSDLYWYISAKRGNLSGQAFAYLEMGRLEKAEELLAEIENISPDIVEKKTRIMRSYHKGRIALEKNDTDTAILHMKNVLLWLDQECHLSRTSHAFHVNSMAEAYMKAGNLDEAISTYEKIPLLTTGRLNWGHVYAQSYYNLGKLYEQKGWKGKAIENYKRFVTLWKDADPQFQPLVEDAKKQLHNLEGN